MQFFNERRTKSHFKACRKIVAFLDFKHQIACSNTLLDWNSLRQILQKSTSFLCTFQESIQIKKGLTAWKRGHEYVYKTPSKKATIPSKKSYEVLQPNIAAGSRAFLKLYFNLNCISILIVFQFTNLKNIFSNFILHYNKSRKRENLLENHIVMKNWIPFQKKLTPLCHTGISNLVSPYFLLVFLWPRFLSFSCNFQ